MTRFCRCSSLRRAVRGPLASCLLPWPEELGLAGGAGFDDWLQGEGESPMMMSVTVIDCRQAAKPKT
jgi:hypothetical protein